MFSTTKKSVLNVLNDKLLEFCPFPQPGEFCPFPQPGEFCPFPQPGASLEDVIIDRDADNVHVGALDAQTFSMIT